jgi:hypothetical protein
VIIRRTVGLLLPICLSYLSLALGVSCSSTGDDAGVTKVKPYHLVEGKRLEASDRSIPFEYDHYMHGAVSSEEKRARQGNYYTVMWNLKASSPAKLRFEYRQANTGSTVKRKDLPVDGGRRNRGTSEFRVTGDEYKTDGKVTAWKIALIQDGSTVDSTQSFLWE